MAIVTGNAKNMPNAISFLSGASDHTNISSMGCAAHTLQLAINTALKEENVQQIIQYSSKIVRHFKHFSVTTQALKRMQEQLSVPKTTLLQSCSKRWNSTYFMLNRLHKNKLSVSNVIADKAITTATVAESLEITERQWKMIKSLLKILKPLQLITNLFCGDSHSPISMVRPLTKKVIEKHLILRGDDDMVLCQLKETLISDITKRFKLD